MPEVHIKLNEPGDIKIIYDKIFTPQDLSLKIHSQTIENSKFEIPLNNYILEANGGTFKFKEDVRFEKTPSGTSFLDVPIYYEGK